MKKGNNLTGATANLSGEKLLKIMEFLAPQKEALRLVDIANSLDINQSTAFRFINTLVQMGYVDQDPDTNRYYMTYKICRLSRYLMNKLEDWSEARPYLEKIAELFGETCCLCVERDRSVIYLEVVERPDSMIRSMQRIGNLAPMHCTGNGKLLLTNYSVKELDRLIEEVGLTRFTEHTITTREGLLKELDRIRKEGMAYDNEECEIGARCIAFPVMNAEGKVIAGISVTGPAQRLRDEMISEKLVVMREIVQKVSRNIGYHVN